jgi:hypothetical protein
MRKKHRTISKFGGRNPHKAKPVVTKNCRCVTCGQYVNPKKSPLNTKERRNEIRDEVLKIKKVSKCVKCGESRPACLGFHHRDRNSKEFNISEAGRIGKTLDEVYLEIAKCDVICHNCHAVLHDSQANL